MRYLIVTYRISKKDHNSFNRSLSKIVETDNLDTIDILWEVVDRYRTMTALFRSIKDVGYGTIKTERHLSYVIEFDRSNTHAKSLSNCWALHPSVLIDVNQFLRDKNIEDILS